MKCEEIRERMPEWAAGFGEPEAEDGKHLESCPGCSEGLAAMRKTMAVLEEWQVPEPSAYFDMRLHARLREEMAKPQAGWLQWFRRPVLAAALTVLIGIGVGLFFTKSSGIYKPANNPIAIENPAPTEPPEPGTAVGDLQALDKNEDLYANFELLDDLDLQQDVVANP